MTKRTVRSYEETRIHGTGVSRPVTRERRSYEHRAAELSPREIVARLHEQIAAKSPEHAALVAAYEQIRDEEAAVLRAHLELRASGAFSVTAQTMQDRMAVYAEARDAGASRREAAAEAGVAARDTIAKYEAAWRGTRKDAA